MHNGLPESLDPATASRRDLLQKSAFGALGLSLFGGPTAVAATSSSGADDFGPLLPPNQDKLQLPEGFTSRKVAVSNQVLPGSGYVWPAAPDGGATYPTADGGWIYVCNSELNGGQGGVGALRFDAQGNGVGAYSILTGTSRNCAGGPTPWGTWLSCEEISSGRVFECDPYTPNSQGVVRPALGTFNHEAVAVDPVGRMLYLTEDESNGLLYRFRPDNYPDLSSGVLEAARVDGTGPIQPGETRTLTWLPVPDPTVQGGTATRFQVPGATTFSRGEGCWYEGGLFYFATTGDNRVWRLNLASQELSIYYSQQIVPGGALTNADNVFVAPNGDVYVAEDSGNLEIVALTPSGGVKPIVRLVNTPGTEITGPALTPDGKRLYFNSQRNPGITFEVTGPFLGTAPPVAVPSMGAVAGALTAAAVAGLGALALRREQLGLREA